jgi:aspartyl-tRNA(Asn)/glutamyl-tRNA(Gln) amidotransferase subunit A
LFSFTSIKDYHILLLNGQTNCVEAVSFYLQKAKEYAHLNAFLELYETEALERAKELDLLHTAAGKLPGKLHGVIIGLKDVLCYANHQVSAASKILEKFTSLYSATAVKRLLQEGAIIIGRQNCDEFAMGSSNENSSFGPVLNALDNNRVAGGSSGGSAVSVQAGLCMIALGSDTGGSVRQPADFCGIIGFKPSYGRVSRYGLIAYASSFDQIGIFGKSIADVALILEVMAGNDEYDSTTTIDWVPSYSQLINDNKKQYKIAYWKQAFEHPGLDPEIARSILLFLQYLKKNGHLVEAIDFELLDYIVPAYYILTTAEASSNLSRFDGVKYGYSIRDSTMTLNDFYKHTRSKGFGKEVKRRIMLGTFVLSTGYYDAYFTKAQQVRKILKHKTNAIFKEYDALISPTVPSTAFLLGEKNNNPIEMFLADIYTVFANLTGIPAISLPLFKHSNQMPFGMQVMCSEKNELLLFRFSEALMKLKQI